MRVQYIPKRDKDQNIIAGIEVGCAYLIPDAPREKYFFMMALHGVGELSNGTIDNLKNLVEGFDWNNDGKRDSGFVTAEMAKAVDQYGIIIAIPTYENNTFFEPAKVNWVYDYVKANYPIHDKMLLTGFSLGGGAVYKYITSSLTNANRVAYAVPVAGTSNTIDKTIPGRANLSVHAFSCDRDPRVSSSNTVNQVDAINVSATLKALYTLFRKDDHAGNNEAWSLTPPKAPDGKGFTDAAENIYQVFTDIVLTGKPRQMKSGAIINPIPSETQTTPPMAVLQPVLEHKVIGNTVYLDGSKSTGMKSAKLAAVEVPKGVNIWNTSIEGGGSAVGKITLTTPGVYKFRLTIYPEVSYKGTPAETDIEVTIGTAQPDPFKPTHTITRADGTKEQVRIETL